MRLMVVIVLDSSFSLKHHCVVLAWSWCTQSITKSIVYFGIYFSINFTKLIVSGMCQW